MNRPNIAPGEPKVMKIVEPTIYAPQACIDQCRTLERLAGDASLQAIQNPEKAFAVVCNASGQLACSTACGARVILTHEFKEVASDQRVFIPNSKRDEDGNTPDEIIRTVLEDGAERFSLADLPKQ